MKNAVMVPIYTSVSNSSRWSESAFGGHPRTCLMKVRKAQKSLVEIKSETTRRTLQSSSIVAAAEEEEIGQKPEKCHLFFALRNTPPKPFSPIQ